MFYMDCQLTNDERALLRFPFLDDEEGSDFSSFWNDAGSKPTMTLAAMDCNDVVLPPF